MASAIPGSFSTQGAAIYNALKGNPNLFLLLGGHVPGEGRRQDTFNSIVVNSLLADYQGRANGGDGWLRIMQFSPANNTIQVKTYSPSLDQYETDGDSQFTLSYSMASAPAAYQLIGTATVLSGGTAGVTWNGLADGTEYEWYATTSDDSTTTTSPTRSFTTATVVPVTYALAVTKSGAGAGTVTSSPAGINCGADCSEDFNSGTGVSLVAAAAPGSTFESWSGACTGVGACSVTMDAAKSVTANFTLDPVNYNLNVAVSPVGGGTTTPAAGDNSYLEGTVVNVTAIAADGYSFSGWSGACTGVGACSVTMDAAKSVTANFTLNSYVLTVSTGGSGTGSVSGAPANPINHGTVVTLIATADAGSAFAGWSGACTNTTGDCVLTMDAAKSVTANFTLNPVNYNLNVAVSPVGGGTTTPAAGDNSYLEGTVVNVTAIAADGYSFSGWSGACTGVGACSVTMDAAKSVTANFTLNTFTLKYTPGAGGTLTGNSDQTVNYGATGTPVEAVADTGYHFVDWSDSSTANPRTDSNVTTNVNVTANFAINTFTLNYAAGTGGTLTGALNQTVNYGASGSAVTALPDAGYDFVAWSDGSTANPRLDTNVMANKSVTANFSLSSAPATISLPAVTGFPNDELTVPVNGSNLQGLLAAGFTVNYDAAVLRIDAVRVGTLTAGWSIGSNEPTPGQLIIGMYGSTATSGNGTIAEIDVTLIGAPQANTTLHLTDLLLNDGQIGAVAVDGSVTINPLLSVAGAIRYWSAGRPVPGVQLALNGNQSFSAISEGGGVFTVEGVGPGAYTLAPSFVGNAGTDDCPYNAICAYDASLVLQHYLGTSTLTGHALTAANVNHDAIIGPLDASLILQASVGNITLPFPGATHIWEFAPENYSYASLVSSQTDQDFTAILLGDPSGNWGSPPIAASAQAGSTITFIPGLVMQDGAYNVDVWLAPGAESNVASLVFDLHYDAAVLEVLEPIAEDGWMMAHNASTAGTLRVAAASGAPITAPTHAVTLRFRTDANGGTPLFTITSPGADEDSATAIIESGRVLLPIIVSSR